MKFKILMIFTIVAVMLNGCSIDDGDAPVVNYEVIPVVSVELPQAFTFGQIHTIPVLFDFTNDCQQFAGFEVSSNLNERVITVVASATNRDCEEGLVRTQRDLRFLAASNGTYVFKFFNGLDVNNEATYLEYTIPVEE
ncbi:hypothetical protein F0365_04625 [Nonlabens sp. Ci31]|jgi:hypothetical protein|uniref:hypothetical protein n=1 Tax=Nonlabens sp. Ci31 TaxID=2608253 RepID=UPI0014644A5D|nr:hypothetical protein [Nonlabens sp. Ci31]QJP33739.1 hypothetical protein F0365_04625 [Nonlabens sp. Ci31]